MIAPEGLSPSPGWWEDLEARYARPQRCYHTIEHVREVWEHWRAVDAEGGWSARAETWIAVLLHDAVYELGPQVPHGSNERASAELVGPWTAQFDVGVHVPTVEALILATAAHGKNTGAQGDLALFLDCDLAILGAPWERYSRYADQVRGEYEPYLPAGVYGPARKGFLETLIGQRIFLSDRFHGLFEDRAQGNLAREIDLLC